MTTALPADFHIWATCILVVLSVVAFASERIRVEVSGLSVLVVLILLFEILSSCSRFSRWRRGRAPSRSIPRG